MSLCFLDAYRAKERKEITDAVYTGHLLFHCTGVRHFNDENPETRKRDLELMRHDPFGHSMMEWTLMPENQVTDTGPFEDVFSSYRAKNVENIRSSLTALDTAHAKGLSQSLAMLALRDRQIEVLELCLEQSDFAHTELFRSEADKVDAKEAPRLHDLLKNARIRDIHYQQSLSKAKKDESGHPEAVFDAGGKYPVNW